MAKEAHGWTRPPPHTWNLSPKCDVTGKRQSFHCRKKKKKQLSTHSPCSPERSKVTASTPALDFWKGKKETYLNSDSAQFCRLSSSQLFQDSFLLPLERSQRCERPCVCWGRGCFEAFLAFHCPSGLFILCFVKLYWTWIWNPLPFYLFVFFLFCGLVGNHFQTGSIQN